VCFMPLLYQLLVTTAAAPAASDRPLAGPHLRCLDDRAAAACSLALAVSPTVQYLVRAIDASDLIVFVRTEPGLSALSARTRFMSATRGARYVLVDLEALAPERQLVVLLGHELQHASEIASAAEVRDERAMRRLFKRIGFAAATVSNGYETVAALDAGRQVLHELSSAYTSLARTSGAQPR
jgi:hypothetical protein